MLSLVTCFPMELVWFEAAAQGNVAGLRAFSCTMLSTISGFGHTPAHIAAANCHVNALQYIHELVPDTLSAEDNDGRTPTHCAAAHGHVKALRYLHELVPDTFSAKDNDGYTPTHYAATNGHVNALQCLYELVPDTLSAQDNNGAKPAHSAAAHGHVNVLRCLYALAPDTLSAQDKDGRTPAHAAISQGHVQVLQCLHKLVPDTLSTQTNLGATPAHYAAANGHVTVLRCLRQLVPDTISAKDNTGNDSSFTPRKYAQFEGHTVAAEYLEACEVWPPLLLAAADRLPAVAEELLHNGADPTASQVYQDTTLTALLVAENLPQAFSWSLEVCPKTVKLLNRAMRWSTMYSRLFPPRFRRGVRHVFGLKVHLEQHQELPMLPAVVWQMIVAELPRNWGLYSCALDQLCNEPAPQ